MEYLLVFIENSGPGALQMKIPSFYNKVFVDKEFAEMEAFEPSNRVCLLVE